MANTAGTGPPPDVRVEAQGDLPPGTADLARDRIQDLLREVSEPVLSARVRLTRSHNPATERPALAQANLDVNGRAVRAHVAADTTTAAVELLHERLGTQLERLHAHRRARRGGTTRAPETAEHPWRHGDEPSHRPDWFPRPAEERRVVRHKSFSLARETPDEAAFEMDTMDYDFHLFTDLGTGEDSVIYRAEPTGYRLARSHPRPESPAPTAVPLTVSAAPAPRMSVDEARGRLEATGRPFVFFADADTGRGNVLYHRYDGHYGLITPAE